MDAYNDPAAVFSLALTADSVVHAARAIYDSGKAPTLSQVLELGRALAEASGAEAAARMLRAEIEGFADGVEVPPERNALGFASSFPVRALDLGLLDPEEIFLANREKFSQVTLTIGQPVEELQEALAQIRQGGVLALKVPASEISGDASTPDEDAEVYIYILPREIQRIIDSARARALDAVMLRIVEATVGRRIPESRIPEPRSASGSPSR